MLRQSECRLNFKNRPVRTRDIKGILNDPLPLMGVARSLPLTEVTPTLIVLLKFVLPVRVD